MNIVAQSPSHRGEFAELSIRDPAPLLHCSARPCYALYALATTMRFRGDCYLGMVNLGASATLALHSLPSGQLRALFKCSPKVGVALFDSRTNSERFNSHGIEE